MPVLNQANNYLGGVGIAGAVGEPIQFQYGQNWFLRIPAGREDARRLIAYIAGRFEEQGEDVHAVWQLYTTSVDDA